MRSNGVLIPQVNRPSNKAQINHIILRSAHARAATVDSIAGDFPHLFLFDEFESALDCTIATVSASVSLHRLAAVDGIQFISDRRIAGHRISDKIKSKFAIENIVIHSIHLLTDLLFALPFLFILPFRTHTRSLHIDLYAVVHAIGRIVRLPYRSFACSNCRTEIGLLFCSVHLRI